MSQAGRVCRDDFQAIKGESTQDSLVLHGQQVKFSMNDFVCEE